MVRLHWNLPAFYFVIAGRNPGWNITVQLSLITMEGDKLTVTY